MIENRDKKIMENSFYKIIGKRGSGCKIFFTDRRMDKFRSQIHEIFNMMDAVNGSCIPVPEDFVGGKYKRIIDNIENIKRKVEDCRHKATAARYSLALIEQELLNRPAVEDMKNYSEMIKNKMCDQAELKNEVLIYEVEAFLFQVRSNLDILIQLLKYVPGFEYLDEQRGYECESFAFDRRDQARNTINKMRNNGDVGLADYFKQQIDEWIRGFNKIRNTITHRSGLVGFTSFIFDSNGERVIDPLMPNGVKVEDYSADIFNKLLKLYKKVFEDSVLPKFN